jgi:hypothetical protein
MGKVQAYHTAKYESEVVGYAYEHGNWAAGRKFDVQEEM